MRWDWVVGRISRENSWFQINWGYNSASRRTGDKRGEPRDCCWKEWAELECFIAIKSSTAELPSLSCQHYWSCEPGQQTPWVWILTLRTSYTISTNEDHVCKFPPHSLWNDINNSPHLIEWVLWGWVSISAQHTHDHHQGKESLWRNS